EEYVVAIAEALRTEYRAIVDAGFILQIDDPGLGETWDMLIPAPPLEEYRRTQARNLDALNHALAGIPEDRVRYHLCWGSWQGPHLQDLGLRDIVDLVLRVIAGADCGFAQGALYQRQHPTVMWAKFEALVQGARLASDRLWGRGDIVG